MISILFYFSMSKNKTLISNIRLLLIRLCNNDNDNDNDNNLNNDKL